MYPFSGFDDMGKRGKRRTSLFYFKTSVHCYFEAISLVILVNWHQNMFSGAELRHWEGQYVAFPVGFIFVSGDRSGHLGSAAVRPNSEE